MAYVRITLMIPLPDQEVDAGKLNRELAELYGCQEGCRGSHVVRAADGSGEIGRVSFWDSEGVADAAATLDRSLYLRSHLQLLVRDEESRSFASD